MPTIYLSKESYDKIVQQKKDVAQYVNRVVEDELKNTEKEQK